MISHLLLFALIFTGERSAWSDEKPDQILVRFKAASSPASHRAALERARSRSELQLGAGDSRDYSLLTLDTGQSAQSAIAELRNDPSVESVQPNYTYRARAIPDDPRYPSQWALKNTGQKISALTPVEEPLSKNNPGSSGMDLNLEPAWDLQKDCKGAPVAVIDTGVNYLNEDLAANMWDGGSEFPNHGWDFVDRDSDPMDLNGHGTHVAGTVGAQADNKVGTAGICWNASLMALRALDAAGSGSSAELIQALTFAIDHGARIINLSLGGTENDPAVAEILSRAESRGILVVVAAANDGFDNDDSRHPDFPCNAQNPNLVCVTALDQAYGLAEFANYGAKSVDLGAPGVNIVSEFAGRVEQAKETFQALWTLLGGWGRADESGLSLLVNPKNWDGRRATYAANADDLAYRSVDTIRSDSTIAIVEILLKTEEEKDRLSIAYSRSGENPFSGDSELLLSASGKGHELIEFDLTPCQSASCSFGFRFQSNASVNDLGVAVVMQTRHLSLNAESYEVLSGNSMAAPHVTGISALVWAAHPEYSPQDVIRALIEGGTPVPALEGKTRSGRAANAFGALSWRRPAP